MTTFITEYFNYWRHLLWASIWKIIEFYSCLYRLSRIEDAMNIGRMSWVKRLNNSRLIAHLVLLPPEEFLMRLIFHSQMLGAFYGIICVYTHTNFSYVKKFRRLIRCRDLNFLPFWDPYLWLSLGIFLDRWSHILCRWSCQPTLLHCAGFRETSSSISESPREES